MLKDAVRRHYDILICFVDRSTGRSVLHVANALAELDAASHCNREGIDSRTPMGRAMIQMAFVFGEQKRSMLRDRIIGWRVSVSRKEAGPSEG